MSKKFKQTLLALVVAALAAPAPAESTDLGARKSTLGPGDVIKLVVDGVDELSTTCRVSNSGKIHVPRLGVIRVDDLTLAELGHKVEERYREREILREPVVVVEILQARARPVYILGEVLMPGQFVINDRMTVLDLLTLSMGLNEVASDVGYLYRRRADQSASAQAAAEPGAEMVESTVDEAIPVFFDRLYENDGLGNVELVPGDVLYVPVRRPKFFYVVGDVNAPGQIELPQDEEVSATRAIGMASGPLKTAKLRKAILAWKSEDGSFEHRMVDLRAILEGKQEDFLLEEGHILFVPGSTSKTLALGMLNAIPGFALQN